MNSKNWLLLAALAACTTKLTACSSSFRSCADTRTCAAAGKGGGQNDAGDAGAGDAGDINANGGNSALSAGSGGEAGEAIPLDPIAGAGGEGGEPPTLACADETDLKSDPKNCGVCRHDCLGGDCEFGKCLPVAIALDQASVRSIATDGVYLYWTASSTANKVYVARRRVDRSDSMKIIASNEVTTSGLTLSASAVYWLTAGHVRVCNTPDCNGASDFKATLGQTCETLLAAGNALFWSCSAAYEKMDGAFWAVTTPASTPAQIEPSSTNPTAIVSEGDNVYWLNSSTYTQNVQNSDAAVWRLRASTGATTRLVTGFTSDLGSIAVGNGKLYFSSPPTIFVTPLPNGSLSPVKFADVSARSMVADEHAVYWTADAKGLVLRCPHSGCASPETLAAGQLNPGPLAQDARSIYWAGIGGIGPILRLAK
jgi:hypothetical protein